MGRTKVPTSKATASRKEKRKRPDYSPTFFNEKAKKLFYDHMKKREGVRERGIIAQYSGIINVIERRRWQRFTEQPEPAVLDVVREFYANARVQYLEDITSRTVLVRGQDVSYDSSTINCFYGLEDFETDEYSAWLDEGPDCDEVLARLCFANSAWKMKDGKPVSFKRGQLTPISRGWHYFISAKLLPSNHVSDVNKERALLNFAIQSRMTINVGKIIEESIINCCTGRLNVHLVHPSLIYQLCVAAGVGSVDEEEQVPLPVINDGVIEILERASGESRRTRESFATPGTVSPSQEDPITPVAPEVERPSTSTTQAPTLRSLQAQVDDLKKGQDRLEKGQRKIKQKLNYLMSFGLSLTVMLKRTDLFKGVKLPNFPEIPVDSSDSSHGEHTSDEEESGSESGSESDSKSESKSE